MNNKGLQKPLIFLKKHLECAAPKCWSKYTTASKQPLMNININEICFINYISDLLIIFGNSIRMEQKVRKIKKRGVRTQNKTGQGMGHIYLTSPLFGDFTSFLNELHDKNGSNHKNYPPGDLMGEL